MTSKKQEQQQKAKGEGKNLKKQRLFSVTTVTGEVTEQGFGELKDKKVTAPAQICPSLTAFCNELTGSVCEGRAENDAYFNFRAYSCC